MVNGSRSRILCEIRMSIVVLGRNYKIGMEIRITI